MRCVSAFHLHALSYAAMVKVGGERVKRLREFRKAMILDRLPKVSSADFVIGAKAAVISPGRPMFIAVTHGPYHHAVKPPADSDGMTIIILKTTPIEPKKELRASFSVFGMPFESLS
jgi:hypothetical protein